MSVPQWLPSWRDTENYPDSETTKSHEWAWEFLRRDENYQADCGEVRKVLAEQGFIGIDKRPIWASEVFRFAINQEWKRRIPCREDTEAILKGTEGPQKVELQKLIDSGLANRSDYGDFIKAGQMILPAIRRVREIWFLYVLS